MAASLPLLHASRGEPHLVAIGYGSYKVPANDAARLVSQALSTGYRHVDTAQMYHNEAGVGAGLAQFLASSECNRDDVFVTSKLNNPNHSPDRVQASFDQTLRDLGLDAVDLFLIHWPMPAHDDYVDVWKLLLEFVAQGRARSVGVSNFEIEHIEKIAEATGELPAVNQIEMHPQFQNARVRDWCQAHGIVVEAWSPLGRGAALNHPVIQRVANQVGATPAQVVLAWHLRHGVSVIPKSSSPERMAENLASVQLELDDDAMAALDGLDQGESGRISAHPNDRN